MKITLLLSIIFSSLFLTSSCSDEPKNQFRQTVIHSNHKWEKATPAGLLIANAIRDIHEVDIVLYPSAFLQDGRVSHIKFNMDKNEVNQLLSLYPIDDRDQFYLGSMKGKDIERFLFLQMEANYRNELQVVGLNYSFKFLGGENTIANIRRKNNLRLDKDKRYQIAISNTFLFSGDTAPGYLFGYGFNFNFNKFSEDTISARGTLKKYVQTMQELPLLKIPTGRVSTFNYGNKGFVSIANIQSDKHISPYRGYKVTTEGIVTGAGFNDKYPGAHELYIQSLVPDNNDKTSEALLVSAETIIGGAPQVGDIIKVSGTVYEDRFNSGRKITNGLTRTSIKEVTNIINITSNYPELAQKAPKDRLPKPILVGDYGRKIPKNKISTYNDNLNRKDYLNLNDGIDFWESLESMRIEVRKPKVVGFSGGKSKMDDRGAGGKSYLNIFITPDSDIKDNSATPMGGVIIDEEIEDFNPHIITLETHPMSIGLDINSVYNVGDKIEGSIEGLLVYDRSFFNSGHYALLLTNQQDSINKHLCDKLELHRAEKKTSSTPDNEELHSLTKSSDSEQKICDLSNRDLDLTTPIEKRPVTQIKAQDNKLTFATYNIENLSFIDDKRLTAMSGSVSTNFNCPDIINFVEVQDDNSTSLKGTADASKTLAAIIKQTGCPDTVTYEAININPFLNGEGGQPGGNIRMSIIYNSSRVQFSPRYNNDPLAELTVSPRGRLSHNPGRLYPNDSAFRGSRKSLIAEFNFKGERVIVVGNHFNSKLGDSSLWGAIQPPLFASNNKRAKMASKLNEFVKYITTVDPEVNVLVAGDFNAHLTEKAMIALEGEELKNLVTYNNLIPINDRYTTNHNGNSQGLDYILASKTLLQKKPEIEILHINSDYMSKHSDHDPVLSAFTFE